MLGWSTDLTEKVLKERDGLSVKNATRKHQLDKNQIFRRSKKIDYKEVAEVSDNTRKGIKKGVPRPVETDEPNTKGLEGANQLTTKEGEINSMFFIDFKDYYIYIM